MIFETLLSFVIATSILAISPGPDNIFVLMQSMVNGKWFGIATVAGLISGCIIHTSLVAFGVSAILKENPNLFFIIKLFGALYLVYLAYKVFQSNSDISLDETNVPKKSYIDLFKQGFIMNVLNPKVTIFFLAFFPGFLFSDTMSNTKQFFVLGFLFMLVSFIIFSTIAFLAGTIAKQLEHNTKVMFYLKWLQIIVFIGIAVFILID